MKSYKNTFHLAICLTLITFLSCTGPQGEVGPQGAKGDSGSVGPRGETGAAGTNGANGLPGATGATGPRGESGATGPQGPKGDAGNANVFYSEWISLKSNILPSRETIINAPKITQEVLNNSDIRMFINIDGGVRALPYRELDYYSKLGQILVTININGIINAGLKVRYVITQGGINIGFGRKKVLESMSYEEVKTLYNIPD
ncbi:MAG: collagen-like protein [Cytophagaceae bacterium]|nr:collagen-like protein [Cytophagaceae bacterium]